MSPLWYLLVLLVRSAELRPGIHAEDAAGMEASVSADSSALMRVPRGARDGSFRRREPVLKNSPPGRLDDPSGFFTTTTTAPTRSILLPSAPPLNSSSGRAPAGPGLLNPLFPVTDGSYWAYAVLLLALVLFAAGIVGNLALMCIVWHNVYLKSAWNCVLAGLAFWDFLVLFFCLPVVIFHELTLTRLLGHVSCRLVPYLEVTSLGVATFSLCALSIDRFHAATGPAPQRSQEAEPCGSILSKVAVIWVGSMVLAAPELLLWQLTPPTSDPASLMAALRGGGEALKVDVCVRSPSPDLPDRVLALVLTYQEARVWWVFGCYLCLPLLFTLACHLVTGRVLSQRSPGKPVCGKLLGPAPSSSSSSSMRKQQGREQRRRSVITALALLHAACNLPHSVCSIVLSYVSGPVLVLPALVLVEQLLLFLRCSATPVLLLSLSRTLGRAFVDCCCCCCEECLPDSASSSSSSYTTATSALSSPTSPSPASLEPVKSGSEPDPAEALGTPC
ncbi:prosaposin receptor GPR37L1 [Austrofundulus limnaeus]|uniref:Prosaposin receptor GPR37L1 n=1 Tax=Austrofundulus limnaeus TaxID=52670 RepID=A0A2I4BSS8_AUSLI|nr:PREDICTED: prosaposin receptor GPR37L1-like [Austrofundulus limnaeus]